MPPILERDLVTTRGGGSRPHDEPIVGSACVAIRHPGAVFSTAHRAALLRGSARARGVTSGPSPPPSTGAARLHAGT